MATQSASTRRRPARAPLLSPEDLSAALGGISIKTLAHWRSIGQGPRYIHIGKRVRYTQAEVDAFIDDPDAYNQSRLADL